MSFSSKSSNKNRYKKANNGSSHYQKKGFLGNLFNIIASRSGSEDKYRNEYQNTPMANQNDISCNKCNSHIPSGSKFCLECGEKVSCSLCCMKCGEKIFPNAKFCLKCGNEISK